LFKWPFTNKLNPKILYSLLVSLIRQKLSSPWSNSSSCQCGQTVSELRQPAGLLFIPEVIYEYGELRWNDTDRGNRRTWRKTCPSSTLFTTNPTWTDRVRTRVSAVRDRLLKAWVMTWHWIIRCCISLPSLVASVTFLSGVLWLETEFKVCGYFSSQYSSTVGVNWIVAHTYSISITYHVSWRVLPK
jgi:hypothetical protein